MRWHNSPPVELGTVRVFERFLWWPKRIGNETRWLEVARWSAVYGLAFLWIGPWRADSWLPDKYFPYSQDYVGHNAAKAAGKARCICSPGNPNDLLCPYHGR